MNLPEYIEKIGDDAAAVLFGVKPRTAKSWRLGDRFPRPKQAQFIVEASKGEVTMDGIYERPPSQAAA
jgi:DNA-binding transcriptional regulator YdaS (Cro superfamily)